MCSPGVDNASSNEDNAVGCEGLGTFAVDGDKYEQVAHEDKEVDEDVINGPKQHMFGGHRRPNDNAHAKPVRRVPRVTIFLQAVIEVARETS